MTAARSICSFVGAAAALVGLLAALPGCERRRRAVRIVTDEAVPIERLAAADIDGLSVSGGLADVTLRRGADGWRLTAPLDEPADSQAIAATLGELERLEWVTPAVTTSIMAWPDYAVEPGAVLTITVRRSGLALPPIHVGDGPYARIGSGPSVYRIVGLRRHTFDRELRLWRELSIFGGREALSLDMVTGVEVAEASGRRARLDRIAGAPPSDSHRLPADSWRRHITEEPVAADGPTALVRRLIGLRAEDRVDIDLAAAGLLDPRSTVTLHTTQGPLALALGHRVGTRRYAGRPGDRRVFLVEVAGLEPDLSAW